MQFDELSTIANCCFVGNVAGRDGGAVVIDSGSLGTIDGSAFLYNRSAEYWYGGGIAVRGESEGRLTNCTIRGNRVGEQGGGIAVGEPRGQPNDVAQASLFNCILWENVDVNGSLASSQIYVFEGSSADVRYSCIQGLIFDKFGGQNVDDDPLFAENDHCGGVSAGLQPGSPCIDAGNTLLAPDDGADADSDGDTRETLPVDLLGNPRVVDVPAAPDTGVPDKDHDGIIDMGAVEVPPARTCAADVDGDGIVGVDDLVIVLLSWGGSDPDPDVDGDGVVGINDLVAILLAWGAC